jgi:transposase
MGKYLSIDEVNLSMRELYTVVTNKKAKSKKGSMLTIFATTTAKTAISHLQRISSYKKNQIIEITLDMANSMKLITKKCFPKAIQVTDRFHVQKLALEALQEIRIKHRWEAMDIENQSILQAKSENKTHTPQLLRNGDTVKQLLARSRYLLYKSRAKWTVKPEERSKLLFELYPDIKTGHALSDQEENLRRSFAEMNIFAKLTLRYDTYRPFKIYAS